MLVQALIVGGIGAGRFVTLDNRTNTYQIAYLPPAKVPSQRNDDDDDVQLEVSDTTYYLHEIVMYARSFYVLHHNRTAELEDILQELMQFYHDHNKDKRP